MSISASTASEDVFTWTRRTPVSPTQTELKRWFIASAVEVLTQDGVGPETVPNLMNSIERAAAKTMSDVNKFRPLSELSKLRLSKISNCPTQSLTQRSCTLRLDATLGSKVFQVPANITWEATPTSVPGDLHSLLKDCSRALMKADMLPMSEADGHEPSNLQWEAAARRLCNRAYERGMAAFGESGNRPPKIEAFILPSSNSKNHSICFRIGSSESADGIVNEYTARLQMTAYGEWAGDLLSPGQGEVNATFISLAEHLVKKYGEDIPQELIADWFSSLTTPECLQGIVKEMGVISVGRSSKSTRFSSGYDECSFGINDKGDSALRFRLEGVCLDSDGQPHQVNPVYRVATSRIPFKRSSSDNVGSQGRGSDSRRPRKIAPRPSRLSTLPDSCPDGTST